MNAIMNILDVNVTTAVDTVSTTELPTTSGVTEDDYKFIIVPLIVIVVIILLSLLVYCMARRRRLNIIRRNLLSLYEFDSNEQEWETISINVYDNPNYTNGYAMSSF